MSMYAEITSVPTAGGGSSMSESGPFAEVDAADQEPKEEGSYDPTEPQQVPTEPEPEKPYNLYGLRNTAIDADPSEIAAELDPSAGPRAHAITGVCKQAGADGVEAWMHYVLALYLVIDPQGTLLGPSDETETDTDADADRSDQWGTIE